MRSVALAPLALLLVACGSGTSDVPPRRAAAAVAPDAAAMGPYTAADQDYDFGRMTVRDEITGDSYDTDIHGYIRYATDAPGPMPVILLQHGRHQTCETGFGQLPVPVGDDNCPDLAPAVTPANSYRGYDYLAENLASHGYAVISVDTNDINDNDGGAGSSDTGALARAELLLAHLDAFRDINRGGGRGFDQLAGRLDLSAVGLMGHSRGGEGVDKAISVNAEREQPHALRAVFALAPTDYNTQAVGGVTFAALLPYCDGDVEDLMGSFAFDNARYQIADDPWPKFQILAMGANHNYFNTVWTSDDWEIHGTPTDAHCGRQAATNRRDTPEQQRALGQFFIASFFRHFVGDEAQFGAYWTGQSVPPESACPGFGAACDGRFHLSVHPGAGDRLLIDTTLDAQSLTSNALDLPVSLDGFVEFGHCETDGRSGSGCPSAEPTFAAAPQLYLSWQGPATYRSTLGGLDVRGYTALSLRAGVAHGDPANADGQDFEIAISDAAGHAATVRASDYSTALFDPPGGTFSAGGSEKTTLNAIQVPLDEFQGVDLSRLAALELRFTQTPAGTVQLTDMMLQRIEP